MTAAARRPTLAPISVRLCNGTIPPGTWYYLVIGLTPPGLNPGTQGGATVELEQEFAERVFAWY